MTAAASSARISQDLVGEPSGSREIAISLAIVVGGGLVEGTALGMAQASAFRVTHPTLRRTAYVLVTVMFAGLGWAAASAPAALAGGGDGSAPPRLLVLAGGALLGATMGLLLGAAQAVVLRRTVQRPLQWLPANAVAWTAAMLVIFLGATTPDAGWATWQVALLGTATGSVAGALLGLVLGRWVPTLGTRSASTA